VAVVTTASEEKRNLVQGNRSTTGQTNNAVGTYYIRDT